MNYILVRCMSFIFVPAFEAEFGLLDPLFEAEGASVLAAVSSSILFG